MKTYAYHPGGVVAEIISLGDDLVPGKDIYLPEMAAEMTDVTGFAKAPEQGWVRSEDGSSFAPPPPPPVYVPSSCSKLGLKRALSETGPDAVFEKPEWPAVSAALAEDPDLKEDWDFANSIRRDDPIVEKVIAMRGYDSETVDKILIRANALAG